MAATGGDADADPAGDGCAAGSRSNLPVTLWMVCTILFACLLGSFSPVSSAWPPSGLDGEEAEIGWSALPQDRQAILLYYSSPLVDTTMLQ